jgi:hypothetical protein
MSEEEEYGAEMELAAYEMATRLEEVEQQAVEALEQLEAAQRAQQEEQVRTAWRFLVVGGASRGAQGSWCGPPCVPWSLCTAVRRAAVGCLCQLWKKQRLMLAV